jgi:hypothetical protein
MTGYGLIAVALIILYFVPAVLGRKKRTANSIAIVNLFFGWTVIGWVGCLAWAASPDKK